MSIYAEEFRPLVADLPGVDFRDITVEESESERGLELSFECYINKALYPLIAPNIGGIDDRHAAYPDAKNAIKAASQAGWGSEGEN